MFKLTFDKNELRTILAVMQQVNFYTYESFGLSNDTSTLSDEEIDKLLTDGEKSLIDRGLIEMNYPAASSGVSKKKFELIFV